MANLPTVEQASANAPVNENLMLGLRNNLAAPIGTIQSWYDYNGTLSVPATYMLCDGSVISEANYNSTHGSGAWDDDIVTTVLNGKYTPNLNTSNNVYVAGGTATQAGTSSITTVGVTGNSVSLQHNHKWIEAQNDWSGSFDRTRTFDSGGTAQTLTNSQTDFTAVSSMFFDMSFGNGGADVRDRIATSYTDNKLSSPQDWKPESVVVKYIIKIV